MAVNQIVLVRSLSGLGYKESQTGSSSSEKDKLVIELKNWIDTLDQALYACQGSNAFLKDKAQLLESSTSQGKRWFVGKKAHNMYQRQAKGKVFPNNLVKKPFNYPGRGKYGCTLDHDICTFCCDNWHRW